MLFPVYSTSLIDLNFDLFGFGLASIIFTTCHFRQEINAKKFMWDKLIIKHIIRYGFKCIKLFRF
jgi:hypothetical protein